MILGLVAAGIAGLVTTAPLLLASAAATAGAKGRQALDLMEHGLSRSPSTEEIAMLLEMGKDPDDETVLIFYQDELMNPVNNNDLFGAMLGFLEADPDPFTAIALDVLNKETLPRLRNFQVPIALKYDDANPREDSLLRAYERGRANGAILHLAHRQKSQSSQ